MTDPVVSTAWLAQHLGDADLCVVDATLPLVGQSGHGRDSYMAGHVPGAVFFDINAIADPDTDLPHMLPPPENFAEAAGRLGLGREKRIVVYDAHGIYSAPRVWWTLRVMGYRHVYVLDGGLKAWAAGGHDLETADAVPLPVTLVPRIDRTLIADLTRVADALAGGTTQVVDARSAGRFRGEAPEPRASLRSGHMPGALNVPFDQVLNVDGTLKSASDLAQVFAGVDLTRPVITSCGSGVTASVLALALARLGRNDVAIYDGSWTEWGGRPDTAVVTGA